MQKNSTKFSFVINSVDDIKMGRLLDSLSRCALGIDYDVHRIGDARSMSEGLNRGAELADGEILIFCHDDIEFLSQNPFVSIALAMQYYDVAGVAGTQKLVSGNWYDAGQPFISGAVVSPLSLNDDGDQRFELQLFGMEGVQFIGGVQALDGIFICAKRQVFEQVGGFSEEHFKSWHGYDIHFTHSAYRVGARICILNDVLLFHNSHPGAFSAEKVRQFETAQQKIETLFLNGEKRVGEDRSHRNYKASSLEEATAMWRRLRCFGNS